MRKMNRLEYKWIIYGENITKSTLKPALAGNFNVALISLQKNSNKFRLTKVRS